MIRRPNRRHDTADRGAILPLVAISMVVLLGMGAMVIDVGHLYAERRQLQNGADAAALAVAQSCAQAGGCGAYTSMAQQYADLSARDGVSAIREICFGGPRIAAGLPRCSGGAPAGATRALGWVKVTTRTQTPDGSNEVDFLLAPIVTALSGYTVQATSIAAWGIAGRGRVLPFAMHECEYNALGGVLDPLSGTVPSGTQYIYSRFTTGNGNDQDCRTAYLGDGTSPGNYGWLDKAAKTDCFVETTEGDWAPGDPGNNPEIRGCEADILDQTVLIAIWRNSNLAGGSNANYEIIGFVGFHVTGYDFSGLRAPAGFTCPPNPADPNAPDGSLRCFRGYFTDAVFDGDFGGYYNTGVTSVKMIG